MNLDRLADWLGRKPEPSPDLAAALDELARMPATRPELAGPARSLSRLLAAAFLNGGDDPPPGADPRSSGHGGRDGEPIFRASPPTLSPRGLKARSLAILDTLLTDGPAARPLWEAVRRGVVDVSTWASDALAGRPEGIAAWAEANRVDPDLAAAVLRLTLLPSLSRITAGAGPFPVDGPGGACPWCGSAPLLGELRGLEREVRLRCGLCAGDWPGGRLSCPSCGEDDHRRLTVRHVEGEADRCRVSVCEACGSRLKLVGTFARLSPPGLIVADLATVHLDLIDPAGPATSPAP